MQCPFLLSLITSQLAHSTACCNGIRFLGTKILTADDMARSCCCCPKVQLPFHSRPLGQPVTPASSPDAAATFPRRAACANWGERNCGFSQNRPVATLAPQARSQPMPGLVRASPPKPPALDRCSCRMISIKGFSQSSDRFTSFITCARSREHVLEFFPRNLAACGGMRGIEVVSESGLFVVSNRGASIGFAGHGWSELRARPPLPGARIES